MDNDPAEVHFQCISANQEEVTFGQKDKHTENHDLQSILEHLHVGGTEEEQAKLAAPLAQYMDVFAFQVENSGCTDRVKHKIHLVDDVPVVQPYRRIPPPSITRPGSISLNFSRKVLSRKAPAPMHLQ